MMDHRFDLELFRANVDFRFRLTRRKQSNLFILFLYYCSILVIETYGRSHLPDSYLRYYPSQHMNDYYHHHYHQYMDRNQREDNDSAMNESLAMYRSKESNDRDSRKDLKVFIGEELFLSPPKTETIDGCRSFDLDSFNCHSCGKNRKNYLQNQDLPLDCHYLECGQKNFCIHIENFNAVMENDDRDDDDDVDSLLFKFVFYDHKLIKMREKNSEDGYIVSNNQSNIVDEEEENASIEQRFKILCKTRRKFLSKDCNRTPSAQKTSITASKISIKNSTIQSLHHGIESSDLNESNHHHHHHHHHRRRRKLQQKQLTSTQQSLLSSRTGQDRLEMPSIEILRPPPLSSTLNRLPMKLFKRIDSFERIKMSQSESNQSNEFIDSDDQYLTDYRKNNTNSKNYENDSDQSVRTRAENKYKHIDFDLNLSDNSSSDDSNRIRFNKNVGDRNEIAERSFGEENEKKTIDDDDLGHFSDGHHHHHLHHLYRQHHHTEQDSGTENQHQHLRQHHHYDQNDQKLAKESEQELRKKLKQLKNDRSAIIWNEMKQYGIIFSTNLDHNSNTDSQSSKIEREGETKEVNEKQKHRKRSSYFHIDHNDNDLNHYYPHHQHHQHHHHHHHPQQHHRQAERNPINQFLRDFQSSNYQNKNDDREQQQQQRHHQLHRFPHPHHHHHLHRWFSMKHLTAIGTITTILLCSSLVLGSVLIVAHKKLTKIYQLSQMGRYGLLKDFS
uniref:Uncharacterized protein n=1 Tax=Sarcoptes scabiei TaxID=52283 RepID=A0A834R916_SARSC